MVSASSGLSDAVADDGVDVHVEVRVLRQPLELLVQNLQALHGHVVGQDVVDADLQPVEACAVQPLDPVN